MRNGPAPSSLFLSVLPFSEAPQFEEEKVSSPSLSTVVLYVLLNAGLYYVRPRVTDERNEPLLGSSLLGLCVGSKSEEKKGRRERWLAQKQEGEERAAATALKTPPPPPRKATGGREEREEGCRKEEEGSRVCCKLSSPPLPLLFLSRSSDCVPSSPQL